MLSLIVAHDRNRVIGNNNELPWHLPEDLAFFRKITTKNTIIMGRNTYDSIGRPLPNRRTVVLTRQKGFYQSGVETLRNINLLEKCKNQPGDYYIIGGEEVFKQALPLVEKMHITYIDEEFEGNTYFPEFNEEEWKLVTEEKGVKDEKNPFDYYFRTYLRK
ncbi:dihydrofolate reductase [Bacillus atrophaeus]|uniref:dihydrofolate reductase n=1 Tax=Bacillus atrophaeus TaxID=1452 RepID=UPI002E206992|nr:dihydrofolate reductase [Bacillus atrophaeus]